MSQILIASDSRIRINLITALSLMSKIHCPNSQVVLGHDQAGPDSEETVASVLSNHLTHLDEWPYYLEREHRPPNGVICRDEQGPWPPVDPVVAKHRDIRMARAKEKRERKNRLRLLNSLKGELGELAKYARDND